MFGIGGFELFLILLFGFLIFGPDKLPGIARTIGKAISRFRNAQSRLNSSLNNEMFDKNSDEPFKNPLDTINRMADAAQTGGSQGAAGAASAGAAAMKAGGKATGGTQKEHAESFAERKARYDKERAARKTAEKQEADPKADVPAKEVTAADDAPAEADDEAGA